MLHIRMISPFKTLLLFLLIPGLMLAQAQRVHVEQKAEAWRLLVDDNPLMVKGMNWDYFPRGTNYEYILWEKDPALIKAALDYEMTLLKEMGVNAIRVYTGISAEWITYIYENYGIYTMLNHSFGRYGLALDGQWVASINYADDRVRRRLLEETTSMVNDFKDTPGLLLYLLGNENNYGLSWEGAETEDIPVEERGKKGQARAMYRLFNEAAVQMKKADPNHPVAICNGDLLYLDLISEEAPSVDILGINVYRGISFTDMYDRVKRDYRKPVLLTEFGSDAFNAKTMKEEQEEQARYLLNLWKEIYENAWGLGKAENSIGGFTFQFTDGWWKTGQTKNLDVHDTYASWANGGYRFDFESGKNNMNEEWFGIAAKGETAENGVYEVHPRAAYYVLQEIHAFDPMQETIHSKKLNAYFSKVSVEQALTKALENQ